MGGARDQGRAVCPLSLCALFLSYPALQAAPANAHFARTHLHARARTHRRRM